MTVLVFTDHPSDCPVCGGVGRVLPGRPFVLGDRIRVSWRDPEPCPWPSGLEALLAAVSGGGPRATA